MTDALNAVVPAVPGIVSGGGLATAIGAFVLFVLAAPIFGDPEAEG